ncbi:synaptojanin-1 isoform X3 [Oopsacas minuta]|uniref:Synaptojanin-1 isoform X3 n=1 Tax=Oopsacas minuta TaxID=111878 RepID=A0AAV7KBQ9_9METZ|nr:synaptojanin-1 isoform X3 [Oopsacas minuta]
MATRSPPHPHTFTKLQLAVFTWNSANSTPLYSHITHIRSKVLNEGIDVLVFGLQENFIKPGSPWSLIEDPILRQLQEAFNGEDLIQVHNSYLLGIIQVVYVRSSLVPFYKEMGSDTIRTGYSGWVGNKGAVCTTFQLGSVTVSCVCAHLCSVESNIKRRNEEIFEILTSYPWFNLSNYSILYGDLNYRLEIITFQEAIELMANKETKKLLQCDQLRMQILTDQIPRFNEAEILFPPSYKLVPYSTNNYNNSKQRTPAWCDRILFMTSDRPTPSYPNGPKIPVRVDPVEYSCLDLPDCSDHKVVYAYFDIYSDWLEYSPPLEFVLPDVSWPVTSDLPVKIELLHNMHERIPTIAKPPLFSSWDWIGLHRFGCMTSSDYLCYTWSPLRAKSADPKSDNTYSFIIKSKTLPRHPDGGLYQLYYHTADKHILAVSHPFSLTYSDEGSRLLN